MSNRGTLVNSENPDEEKKLYTATFQTNQGELQRPVRRSYRSRRTLVNEESETQDFYRTVVNNEQNNEVQGKHLAGRNASRPTQLNTQDSDFVQPSSESSHSADAKLSVDSVIGNSIELRHGDQLLTNSGKTITIRNRIGSSHENGESDVFLCSSGSHDCVVKLFRRAIRNAEKKLEALQQIQSDYIAPIIDSGFYVDRYYEVYNYYAFGSLADELRLRTFPYVELGKIIIPQMITALKTLHDAHILHRDIKPSNILWKDSSKTSIVLIDFGLSSIIKGQAQSTSIVVSQTGFTMAYAAPEILRNFCYSGSDYYSLGIVLYELFCGNLPFRSSAEAAAARISKPANMPKDLYDLIRGLTYNDITYRNEEKNPNRRWGYNDVYRWLSGENLPIPGSSQMVETKNDLGDARAIPPFSFCETTYYDVDSLCMAFAADWEKGKACIMRGIFLQHLRRQTLTNNQALWVSQIDDITNNSTYSSDQKLLHIIRALSPNRDYIVCPLGCFTKPQELGKRLLACMQSYSPTLKEAAIDAVRTVLTTNELSSYFIKNNSSPECINYIQWFETIPTTDRWKRQKESIIFELAYYLSDDVELDLGMPDGTIFYSANEIQKYLIDHSRDNFKEVYKICNYFLDGTYQLKPKVFGWLRHQGYQLNEFNL